MGTTYMITALDSNNDFVAHGDKGGQIGVWQVHSAFLKSGLLSADKTMVQALAFVSGGLLLAASDDGIVRLWQVTEEQILKTWKAHNGSVVSISACPKGTFITSGYDRLANGEPWSLQEWHINDTSRISSTTQFGTVTATTLLPWDLHAAFGGAENSIY